MSSGFLGLTSADLSSDKNEHLFVDNYVNILGTSHEIKIVAADQHVAEKAETRALNEIEHSSLIKFAPLKYFCAFPSRLEV